MIVQRYKVSEAVWSLDINDNQPAKLEHEDEASGACMDGDEREEVKRLRKENRMLWMERGF